MAPAQRRPRYGAGWLFRRQQAYFIYFTALILFFRTFANKESPHAAGQRQLRHGRLPILLFANQSETMLKKTFLLTIFAISAIVCRAVSIDQMVLTGKRISTANGLSSNTVYDMAQDNDGFIWMGAAYGLCRYDGYSFVNYLSLSSDKNRNIDANIGNIHCDSSNRLLWIHTATLTFACYDLTAGRFVDYTRRATRTAPTGDS